MPATENRKQFELRALGLRDFAGVRNEQVLDPFALARFARLLVVDFDRIQGLSPESRSHLLGDAADEWSGGACSKPLPDGWRLISGSRDTALLVWQVPLAQGNRPK